VASFGAVLSHKVDLLLTSAGPGTWHTLRKHGQYDWPKKNRSCFDWVSGAVAFNGSLPDSSWYYFLLPVCSFHTDHNSSRLSLQNEFTTEGGKLHDAVKGVMSRWALRLRLSMGVAPACTSNISK